jgi:nucleoside phosphorylase
MRIVSRFTDLVARTERADRTKLPAVAWPEVAGPSAPALKNFNYGGPNAALPKADIVILTWTSAEWEALDHVFLNSATDNIPSSSDLEQQWHLYSLNAAGFKSEYKLWGYYQLATVKGKGKNFTVLLFKSSAHLAHAPYLPGLVALINAIIAEAQPGRICSIGTAGGANDTEKLGDVVVTNAAHLQVTMKDNTAINYNNQTFTCQTWYPATDLFQATQTRLFFPLNKVVNAASLATALQNAKKDYPEHNHGQPFPDLTVNDLLNSALQPANLGSPRVLSMKGTPVLTTDNYYIAPNNTPYAALEMDDAVVAHAAGLKGVNYAFIRNISDTFVPAKASGGKTIPDPARLSWSSAIYDSFGLYTSFNGALAAWATIAAASA